MENRKFAVKIKICGLTREEDIAYVNEALPDYVGFVIGVPNSIRNITPDQVRMLCKKLAPSIIPVGVFRNAPVELAAELVLDGTLRAVQLHGDEDENYVRELRRKIVKERRSDFECEVTAKTEITAGNGYGEPVIIKAFHERTLENANNSSADLILLDHARGGIGETFDWELAKQIHRPFFLAGGIGPDNIKEAVRQVQPWGVDMSSKVETDGKKDREKILQAVRMVRQLELQTEYR